MLFAVGSMPLKPSKQLDTFPNPAPDRDYEIAMDCPEFTCLCPLTGQPDFAKFKVVFVPDQLCVELKSFKAYLWSFRDEGAFHEKVTNRVMDDLVKAMNPRRITVTADWNVRGGIYTTVTCTWSQESDGAKKPARPAKGKR